MPGAVRRQHVLDLVHDHALAGRSALVGAEILIGVEPALPVKHADLDVTCVTMRRSPSGSSDNFATNTSVTRTSRLAQLATLHQRLVLARAGFRHGTARTFWGPGRYQV